MRAKEFIIEVNPATGFGNMLGMAAKGLGTGAKNILNIAGKTTKTLGSGVGKGASNMAQIMTNKIGKTVPTGQSSTIQSSGSSTGIKPPPQTTDNPNKNQPMPTKVGDTIEVPNIGPSKVIKSDGTNITLQMDPNDPNTTITTTKKKLGLK